MNTIVRSQQDIDRLLLSLTQAEAKTREVLRAMLDSPHLLDILKFDRIGFDPANPAISMNLVEQINLTATYLVAIRAVEMLLKEFPGKEWRLKPGPSGAGSDIESTDGEVCAEIFAATACDSNNKLGKDLDKIQCVDAKHRFVFYTAAKKEGMSSALPIGVKVVELERTTANGMAQ